MSALALFTPSRIITARDFLLPLLIVCIVFMLPPTWAAYAIVSGGQAHFLMAYLYQYRGGKMRRLSYLLRAALLLIAAYLFFAYFSEETRLLFLLATNLFAIHFSFDEFTLHEERAEKSALLSLLGFIAVYASVSSATITASGLSFFPLLTLGVAAISFAARAVFFRTPLSRAERYLCFVAALLLIPTLLTPGLLDPYSVTAIVAWLHFYNWMIGYGIRVHGKPIEKRYWTETAITTVASFVFLFLYLRFPDSLLALAFSFPAYNAWAIGHIVLSFEPGRA